MMMTTWLVIICDGGKRGGVTYGSYKFIQIIETKEGFTGDEIYHCQVVFGSDISTSNEAEYAILITALKKATEYSVDSLSIILDSSLVKYQIEGIYNCYSENLNKLMKKARTLLENFDSWTITLARRNFIKMKLGH